MERQARNHRGRRGSLREILADVWFLTRRVRRIRQTYKGNLVPPPLRERLMLAVVSVYGCRFCSWAHTREALRSGIEPEEVTQLLCGVMDSCPLEEATAVLYALHWADSDARPDPDVVAGLEQTYGPEKAEEIHLILRMNRLGNLTGNTWDHVLRWASRGRLPR